MARQNKIVIHIYFYRNINFVDMTCIQWNKCYRFWDLHVSWQLDTWARCCILQLEIWNIFRVIIVLTSIYKRIYMDINKFNTLIIFRNNLYHQNVISCIVGHLICIGYEILPLKEGWYGVFMNSYLIFQIIQKWHKN